MTVFEFLCFVFPDFNSGDSLSLKSFDYFLRCLDTMCHQIQGVFDSEAELGVSAFVTLLHTICSNETKKLALVKFLKVYYEFSN